MYTKAVYVAVDLLAIASMILIMPNIRHMRRDYYSWLWRTLLAGVIAISANICIAVSPNETFAEISYCLYFSSIDWLLFFLTGFCISYTEYETWLRRLSKIAAVIMAADTVSIFANPFLKNHFYIIETKDALGTVFYQTGFNRMYYLHLEIDYLAVATAFLFIIIAIMKTYSLYRVKYVMILSVLLLVVVLNFIYMRFQLLLDASVVFYAVAGTLIYFSIRSFVPRTLLISSTGRAVDDMNEGLLLFDISSSCIYANAFARNRFGIDPASYDFSCEPIRTVTEELKERGETFGEADYVTLGRAGGKFSENHYRIKYNCLADKKGRPVGSYFLIEDTTETTYYLKELKEARENADNANRAKSTFLANMSHEIRTPLNSVLGMNEMIMRSTDDPQIIEYAENIQASSDILLRLINDILDFSKIEAKKMDMVPVEYSPHDLLTECYDYFEHSASSKDLYLKISCSDNMPTRLLGDVQHIRQIFSNLISNAVKYTREGGVTVNAICENTSGAAVRLKVSVTDTGIGIDPGDIDYLFDAFKRVNEKQNATIQGTGLGLAIARDLVELMHGAITVESAPGQGSTFTVIIPQNVADPTPAGPYVRKHRDTGKKHRESFTAEGAHILIVDDVALNIKVAKALLRNTKITMDDALGGNEAIEKCRNTRYDLILLDHRMPSPDGIETFRAIRAEGANMETPAVMLTANVLKGVEEEYMKMGFCDYLAKPIKSEMLEQCLIRHLPAEKVHLTE
ncbi:MAG: response regulator [Lachnospiraceae bacterium]|nr:response regulator [Lachnospiraceae bacterium]